MTIENPCLKQLKFYEAFGMVEWTAEIPAYSHAGLTIFDLGLNQQKRSLVHPPHLSITLALFGDDELRTEKRSYGTYPWDTEERIDFSIPIKPVSGITGIVHEYHAVVDSHGKVIYERPSAVELRTVLPYVAELFKNQLPLTPENLGFRTYSRRPKDDLEKAKYFEEVNLLAQKAIPTIDALVKALENDQNAVILHDAS